VQHRNIPQTSKQIGVEVNTDKTKYMKTTTKIWETAEEMPVALFAAAQCKHHKHILRNTCIVPSSGTPEYLDLDQPSSW
jgi:hypothetical protein